MTCLSFWPSQKRCHTVPLTLSCCATYVPWIIRFCLLNLCCSHGCSWSRIQWYLCGGALCTAQFQVPQSCRTRVGRRGSELEILSACLPAVTRKLQLNPGIIDWCTKIKTCCHSEAGTLLWKTINKWERQHFLNFTQHIQHYHVDCMPYFLWKGQGL